MDKKPMYDFNDVWSRYFAVLFPLAILAFIGIGVVFFG